MENYPNIKLGIVLHLLVIYGIAGCSGGSDNTRGHSQGPPSLSFKIFEGEQRERFAVNILGNNQFAMSSAKYPKNSKSDAFGGPYGDCPPKTFVGLSGDMTSSMQETWEKAREIFKENKTEIEQDSELGLEGESCGKTFKHGYSVFISREDLNFHGKFPVDSVDGGTEDFVEKLKELLQQAHDEGEPADNSKETYRSGEYPKP
jgi:hypothetical protein